MSAHDVQSKLCKVCNELKTRIQFGTFTDKKDKRWVDGDGKMWNGRMCPQCQVIKAAENMKKLRGKTDA
jgi:hypothetical protein